MRRVRLAAPIRRPPRLSRLAAARVKARSLEISPALVHRAELAQQQRAGRGDQAAVAVDQRAAIEVEGDAGFADQNAASALVEAFQVGVEQALGADPALLAVVQPGGHQGDAGVAADAAVAAVVQHAGADIHRALGADHAGTAVVEAGALQRHAGIAEQPAALVVQRGLAGQRQRTGAGEGSATVVQARGARRQAASLTSAPPWLSSTPPRLTLRLFWLSSRPPSPLNSSPPSRLRPSRPASTPWPGSAGAAR